MNLKPNKSKRRLRRGTRHWRFWSTLFLAGFTLYGLAAWYVGGVLVAAAHRSVGPPPTDFPAMTVAISSQSGTTLAGWHFPLEDSMATVILLHPIRGDRRAMYSRARLFKERGYSTLLVDLQAHGESTGKHITFGWLERLDVLATVDFVHMSNPDHKIAIVGRSLGGAAALLANPNVDALILESVYSTVKKAVHNRLGMRIGPLRHLITPALLIQLQPRLGVSANQLRPINQLEKFKGPVLIAGGDQDQHTTLDETKCMFAAANERKRLVVFEGAAHVDLLAHDPSRYQDEIVDFVDTILKAEE